MSPLELLEKAAFPHQAPWQQRRKLLTLLWSAGAGLALGGLVVALILWQNTRH